MKSRALRLSVLPTVVLASTLGLSAQERLGPLPVLPMPDDGKTPETIHEVPITAIDPPEQDFFSKRLDYRGIPIKGHAVVADEAFHEAWRRFQGLESEPARRLMPTHGASAGQSRSPG